MRHSSLNMRCMPEWLLSGHCMLTLVIPQGASKGWSKKTPNVRFFQLYQYLPICYQPTLTVFIRFWLYPSNTVLDINATTGVGSGLPSERRKSLGTKQTQFKLNIIRGCPMGLASHIQPQLRIMYGTDMKIQLDPHLTKYKWGSPILRISMLLISFWIFATALGETRQLFNALRVGEWKLKYSV